ncbi:1-acyl-sn-glycerol-3-phosphate acyltransferase [Radiobacillus kanasensis]|uniref:lysophospholipid acyltransferase family protein n=1 Tax=Radiobacillus kanasensis TaxID=2844358 RepID=UPI001E3BB43B|nr:lysophospholipid acyltransferase family protein [Radiobacillus kanasensis]UFU00001.1 1-acyl-sn-glycerol-3-phosphate acyltransferase [Radiobacillus kanasensis]
MRSLWIYVYAAFCIMRSVPKLLRIDKRAESVPSEKRDVFVFETPKTVSQKVFKKTGSTIEVVGKEHLPEGPALFVANHQGLFDIPVLLGYLGKPIGFIAKEEIKKIPVIPNWMIRIHCVFLNRKDRRGAVQVINDGIDNLKAGHSMVIFPEGTRSRSSKVHEFKPGSLRLGTKSGVPIVPVAINGTYKMMEEKNGKLQGTHIQLTICNPITPEQYQGLKNSELAVQIQHTIEAAILPNQ